MQIAAPQAVVQAVLTNYPAWPELFTKPIEVLRIEQIGDRVLTELQVNHGFLFGKRRLICENRPLPDDGVVSTLVGGDFRQYVRTWRLGPGQGNRGTEAELDLLIEIETWAPDWILVRIVRSELEGHFGLLRQAAQEQAARDRIAKNPTLGQ